MILWFGNKKKKEELKAAGLEAAAQEAEAAELARAAQAAEDEAKAADAAEIERKVAEANAAWEERQKRDRAAAEAEASRLAKAERRAEADRLEAARKATAARQAAEHDEAAAAALREAEVEAAKLKAAAEAAAAARAETEAARAKADAELQRLDERREARALREAAEAAARERALAEANDPGFVSKLGQGLSRSSTKLASGLAIFNKKKIDDEMLEDLEDLLITSDLGASVAARVTQNLAKERFDKEVSSEEIRLALADEIETVLKPHEQIVDFSDGPRPRVVLFVGVNGSGKTTTIGKIASKLTEQGAKALLVAGDTFRAAAIEQLTVWGERAGIPVMSKPTGADAAGLVFEAIEQAKAEDLDLVLVDTAGRLQNKAELMDELEKIVRVVKKLDPLAPHDVILVLDATVGQNALSQVEAFKNTAGVTGLVMTKLDGTAKGGVLVAIAEAHDLPIHFIGVGESAEDLKPFSAQGFARALVGAGAEDAS
jgi:fused signal recognition particle receptor